jgi:hypothetical protein
MEFPVVRRADRLLREMGRQAEGKPGKRQIGIFGLASLPGDQADALRRRAVAVKKELLDLVLVPGGPDAKALLEEGTAG